MHQRATLLAREDGAVELLVQRLVAGSGKNQATARAAQGLVSGGSDHMGMGQRARVVSSGYQTCHVGHVYQQPGTHFIGDIAEPAPVDDTGVRRETGDDHFRLVAARQPLDFLVADLTGLGNQTILDGIVVLAGKVRRRTMGQVTAVGQTHAKDGISR